MIDGVALPSGDFVVYQIYAVKQGDPAAADKKTVEALKTSLEREHGQVDFRAYVDALKESMKITRHMDKL